MECNKDEAVRAKEIAERKFTGKDIAGAKKFALKAQSLYPELDGISQMLATFDVHLCAERKVNGESDWYGILGANPTADEDTIRKQFRKLALTLHPDKNKSIGADGAFKLISEAWNFLSDKAKRSAYDQKRRAKILQRVATAATGFAAAASPSPHPPPAPGANGFYNFAKQAAPAPKVQKTRTERAASTSQKPKSGTFWSVCHECKMQFEYLRVYINNNLVCPNCRLPFYAAEITPPTVNPAKSSKVWSFAQNHNNQTKIGKYTSSARDNNVQSSSAHDPGSNQNHWVPFSGSSGASKAAQAANMVQQAYERVKREREEAQASTRKHVRRKTSAGHSTAQNYSVNSSKSTNCGKTSVNHTQGQSGGSTVLFSFAPEKGNSNTSSAGGVNKLQMFREVPQPQLQQIIIGKAQKEIHGKVDDRDEPSNKSSSEDAKWDGEPQKEEEMQGETIKVCNTNGSKKSPPTSSNASKGVENEEELEMTVSDPDFHNFDMERTENAFQENQVWAAYDDDDGMPRYYAIIHNVISKKPFKVRLSWLNSKTNTEFAPINWVSSGFRKTCGDFRIGKHETSTSLNSFSHQVRWMKGKGIIFIFPKMGEIWALYKNWSPDWSKSTSKEIVYKYDIVEVLEDYNEERGVPVAPLVKVDGFKTVFYRDVNPKKTRRISREEMFRFSHSVPSHLLTDEEAPDAAKGCWDLDPAALSLDLIQPSANVQEVIDVDES